MSSTNDGLEPENTYVINHKSHTEVARLFLQEALLTREMGGVFPERADLSSINHVLDIACGPGGWASEMAYQYRHLQVVGIDVSEAMITEANRRRYPNATFQVMDVRQPLTFPDLSFDLVNARLLYAFMPKDAWLQLSQECFRITRPSGLVRLTECEYPLTNSPACEQFADLYTEAIHRSNQSFSPNRHQIGITPMLADFLHRAGYQNVRHRAFAIDFSARGDAHAAMKDNLSLALILLQPFLIKFGVSTQQELSDLYTQALREMASNDFCGLWYYLTVWGEKTGKNLLK